STDGSPALNVLDDPVQLVEAVIADHDPAALLAVLDADRGAEPLRELRLEPPNVRILRLGAAVDGGSLLRLGETPDRLLGLADAPALANDAVRELELDRRRRNAGQRAGVAHIELAPLDERSDGVRQFAQPQQVADGRARPADGLGGLGVRHVELVDQALERTRLLERIQVLALDILDQRDGDRGLVRDIPDHGRDLLETCELRGAPSTLARNDLVARLARTLQRPDDDRLHDALLTNRIGELRQRLLAHVDARLVAAALEQVDRQLSQHVVGAQRRRCRGVARGRTRGRGRRRVDAARRRAEQRFEAPPETSSLR